MELEADHEIEQLQDKIAEEAEEIKGGVEKLREEIEIEKKEQAGDRAWINQVALSTGIFSALAAIAAMHGNHLATEGMLTKMQANDQWSFFQAKSTKRHIDESSAALLQSLEKPVPPAIADQANRLDQEKKDIETQATQLDEKADMYIDRHERFASSVAALQVAISLGALAALLRRRPVWYLSLGLAAVGLGFMIWGFYPGAHGAGESSPPAASSVEH